MIYLKLMSLDSGSGIERFYKQSTMALASRREDKPLILDCSSIGFVRPASIAALITVARHWHRVTGYPVHLQNIPLQVHQYLERVNVFTQCESWMIEDQALPAGKRYERSRNSMTLLEVLPIAGEEGQNSRDIQIAHNRASHIIESWFDADEIAVGRLLTMFSEIASNVVHSRDQGFAIMQRYRGSNAQSEGNRVVIAITDLGIGIEASLRNKSAEDTISPLANFTAGSQYLLHALQLGVTARRTVGGLGLHRVKGLVVQWDGILEIRSHRSLIQVDAVGIQETNNLPEIPGTQVTISIQGT